MVPWASRSRTTARCQSQSTGLTFTAVLGDRTMDIAPRSQSGVSASSREALMFVSFLCLGKNALFHLIASLANQSCCIS